MQHHQDVIDFVLQDMQKTHTELMRDIKNQSN